MNMKFYMTPGSCSTAIHIILEELEEVFEAHIVNLPAGDQFKPEYPGDQSQGQYPCADASGRHGPDRESRHRFLARTGARARKTLAERGRERDARHGNHVFVAGSIHGHGFARIFATGNFCLDSSLHEIIKAQGRALVEKVFSIVDKALEGRSWIAGDF